MGDTKPGWQTTEFWISLVSAVITILVLLGYVPHSDVEMLKGVGGGIIVAVFAVIANGLVLYKYISGRVQIKTEADRFKTMTSLSQISSGPSSGEK